MHALWPTLDFRAFAPSAYMYVCLSFFNLPFSAKLCSIEYILRI